MKAWLGWFGKSNGLPEDKIKLLQEAFPVNGESLLGYSEAKCEQFCMQAGLQPSIGTSLYAKLRAGTVLPNITIYLSIYRDLSIDLSAYRPN